jgi:galactokinase/mevalonate kinase-like predicted kinase
MDLQHLISLPPAMVPEFATLTGLLRPSWVAVCDPPNSKLGSGGGVAHLLAESWKATGSEESFSTWMQSSRKLLLMAGGQSRRLPAYAAVGKLMIPMPVMRWAYGQSLDQTLLDLQLETYERALTTAGPSYCAMVTSGDVLLRFNSDLTGAPQVDVLGLGMWVRPEIAGQFGVFFSPRRAPHELSFFLQKPSAAQIHDLSAAHVYLVDTGIWLLSAKAVEVLMRKCGWNTVTSSFDGGAPSFYELYAEFGLSLGTHPTLPDPEISALSCAVLPLPGAEFYHLGTSRQLIESASALQNLQLDQTKLGGVAASPHPDQYVLNSIFETSRDRQKNHTLWIENSHVPSSWQIEHEHVVTGVPENDWKLHLPAGTCLDVVPAWEKGYIVRPYGIDDAFKGPVGDARTLWFGRPVLDWFSARGMRPKEAGISEESDLQFAPLFPAFPDGKIDPELVQWMIDPAPLNHPHLREQWLKRTRVNAQEIGILLNPSRLLSQRKMFLKRILPSMAANFRWNPFYRLDLVSTARLFEDGDVPLPPVPKDADPSIRMHDAMFRSAVLRRVDPSASSEFEALAFRHLREGIIGRTQLAPVVPRNTLIEDQIVWGRCPVRIDLAGGWTDTPPYCLQHGGRVLNFSIDLNGQPPVQVFAKRCAQPELVIRSIDLGVETRVRTYEDLDSFAEPGSEFALAKAALALVGFLPRFHAEGGAQSLRAQLESFGGGIEISLLAAIPKGSGLGTSSILSATLLGVLSDLCGLGWDQTELSNRTLALEQMLTTGGGWQDQIGGITRGIKKIETLPGFEQVPSISWAPEHLLRDGLSSGLCLLYYSGVTRMAKNILQEIVRGMFLNSRKHLEILGEIRENAETAYRALQSSCWSTFCSTVRKSWELNQRLDAGTNPASIAEIIARVQPWLEAVKLPGAGGGGYLLFLAKDAEAARRIRRTLTESPPNPRARFMDFSISDLGLQITRS